MNTSIVSQSDKTTADSLANEYPAGPIQTPAVSNLGVLLRLVIAFIGGLAVYGPALLIQKIPAMDVNADALNSVNGTIKNVNIIYF